MISSSTTTKIPTATPTTTTSATTSTTAVTANLNNAIIPPIVHAIGGSIGSTLSLLLLYPLERARIEMQAQQVSNVQSHDDYQSNSNDISSFSRDDKDCNYEGENEGDIETLQSQRQPLLPSSDENSHEHDVMNPMNIYHRVQYNANDSIYQTIQKLNHNQELYKGVTPVALTLGISNFIFFYALQLTKKILSRWKHSQSNNASLLASTIAGVINVLITNPLWMANLRLIQSRDQHCTNETTITRQKMTLFKMILNIVQKEGMKQLWNGTCASLILVCNPVIQYYIYERWKYEIILHRKNKHFVPKISSRLSTIPIESISPMEAFLLGAIAKAIATVASYPLQLAQVLIRLQRNQKRTCSTNHSGPNQHDSNNNKQQESLAVNQSQYYFTGTLDCIKKLYKQGGIKALYAGMDAKMLQTVLTSALTFLSYEQIVNIVAKSYSSMISSRSSLSKK